MQKKIADKDTADEARNLYDSLVFLRGSGLGQKLEDLFREIQDDSMQRSMYGKTPENQNDYFETRGKLFTIREIRDLFTEIEEENQKAVEYLATVRATGKEA